MQIREPAVLVRSPSARRCRIWAPSETILRLYASMAGLAGESSNTGDDAAVAAAAAAAGSAPGVVATAGAARLRRPDQYLGAQEHLDVGRVLGDAAVEARPRNAVALMKYSPARTSMMV